MLARTFKTLTDRWITRSLDRQLLARVDDRSRPILDPLAILAGRIEPLSLNVKQLGYDLARRLADALPPPGPSEARQVGLACKPSTQSDIESDWVGHWCAELGIPRIYHRKIWEFAFVLQAIFEAGALRAGARGLGFGCGAEPIASYLASRGVSVTATDLAADDAHSAGWARTGQHADHLGKLFHPHLVDRTTFEQRTSLRIVDMNAIPDDLADYDLCWSICALEHLGSIAKGMAFIKAAMRTLRPGGVAVHTTEYNIRDDGPTIDNWPTVLFQRRHLETLAELLRRQGHWVAPFDFDLGTGPMDRFVDVPPWSHDLSSPLKDWLGTPLHLKVAFDGFPVTCFGLVIRKGG